MCTGLVNMGRDERRGGREVGDGGEMHTKVANTVQGALDTDLGGMLEPRNVFCLHEIFILPVRLWPRSQKGAGLHPVRMR